jgi:transcriptional regulator with XRE-family HTH domain
MNIPIDSLETLGHVIRAVRKAQGLRQDDTAGSTGVSENFLAKLERGGTTVQLGKAMQVLQELGIHLSVDVPESAGLYLNQKIAIQTRAGKRRAANK